MKLWGKNKKITIVVALTVLLVVFVFGGWFYAYQNKPIELEDGGANFVEENKPDAFKDILLEAESAYVWDAKENRELYSFNGEAQLPLASLTKMMTALVASSMIPKGTIVTIDQKDLNEEGDNGLVAGEKWSFADLLNFTLVVSSNDGAHAIASVVGATESTDKRKDFVDAMNNKAKELGLAQTYFLNESGLDVSVGYSGAYGSARDMAILMENIIEEKPELLDATKYSNLIVTSKNYSHNITNTNQIVETIPGIVGSKTGFTDLAGGNLVISFDVGINHPIIISVLGSSKEGRFSDVEKLVEASIKSF